MESIRQSNFMEDFEHESRKIEYKVDPDKPGLPRGGEDGHKSIPFFDETLCLSRGGQDSPHKGVQRGPTVPHR